LHGDNALDQGLRVGCLLVDAFMQGSDLRLQVLGLLRGYRLLGLKLLRGLLPEFVFSRLRLRALCFELLAQVGERLLLLGFIRLVPLLRFGDLRLQVLGLLRGYRLLGLKLLRGLLPDRVFASLCLCALRFELLAQVGERLLLLGFIRLVPLLRFGDLRLQVLGLLRGYRLLGLKLLRDSLPEFVFSGLRLRALCFELLALCSYRPMVIGKLKAVKNIGAISECRNNFWVSR
jgi:hypothetical protein